MATWSEAEVINAALERLGVKAVGHDASAEDYSAMSSAYTSKYYQLRREGHAPWAIGAVEEEFQTPLVKVLAGEMAGQFGFTGQRRLEIESDATKGKRELVEQASGDRQPTPIRSEYF